MSFKYLYQWLIGFLGTSALITVSYRWFDRPIALWVHDHFRHSNHEMIRKLGHFPDPLIPLAIFGIVFLGLRSLTRRLLSAHEVTAFVCSIAIIVAEVLKDQLKYLFGRTWPETWTQNNPSLIRNGVYGFNFMHGGSAFQAFPSGHMGAACVVLTMLWMCYPTFRWLYIIAGVLVGAALVAGNYHFLSDVIAGAFVGISISWTAFGIWKVFAHFGAQNMR